MEKFLSFTDIINGIDVSYRKSKFIFTIWISSANEWYGKQIKFRLLQELTLILFRTLTLIAASTNAIILGLKFDF